MQDLMITLLICSGTMSVLALFYMSAMPFLSKRYSAAGCYYTWLIVVIGLIIPFRPQFNNAIVRINMPGDVTIPVMQTGRGAPVMNSVERVIPSALPYISWWEAAAVIWLAGVFLFLAYHVIKHCRFLKLAARWSKNITDEQTATLLKSLKIQMGIPGNIDIQLCGSIGSPMMIGFVKPRILLPETDFAIDELYFILKHELVHYKRKDIWYKCLVLIATAIHWFNPVVYLMAKAIDMQCELSCDEEVVCGTDAGTRLCYSETIIGVVRYQSKLKTDLSTHFYGGRKGMKERIFSIMDRSNKKTGAAVLCGVLILTSGTGFVARVEAQGLPQMIKEDVKEDLSFAYKFLPDPAVYSQYSSYGIIISGDGERLLYNGKRVRTFVDEYSDDEVFFSDEAGTIDLIVARNTSGNITGIENIPEKKAQEYRSAFFDGGAGSVEVKETVQETENRNKLEQYSAYGVTLSADGEALYYNGQRVKLLVDELPDGSFETFWTDEAGTVNLSVVRNADGKSTAIESISDKQVQKYYSKTDEYERNILNGVEKKVEEKMKILYPEE